MRLRPLQEFICDECGQLIKQPKDGWLEWCYDDDVRYGFRIVHHRTASPRPEGCYYLSRRVMDNYLESFTGPDGLVYLLSKFEYDSLKEPRELTDIIRRLHVPHYEEARQYWQQAEDDGFFGGANEYWPYCQDTLLAVIRRYSE